jgi:hypothetical protein
VSQGAGCRTGRLQATADCLVGSSTVACGRTLGEYGRVSYVTTDEGSTMPPTEGVVWATKVLRVELTTEA